MDNAFIIGVTNDTFICTDNTTGGFGVASFTGNAVSRNIININTK